MKLIILFLGAVLSSAAAEATMCWGKCAPTCRQLEDKSFAWSTGDEFISDNCKGQIAKCEQVGTENEGWYKYAKTFQSLGYSQCGDATDEPVCVNVGTRSEGWHVPGSTSIVYANCADQAATCLGRGTRSEGWAVVGVDPEPIGLISKEKCSTLVR